MDIFNCLKIREKESIFRGGQNSKREEERVNIGKNGKEIVRMRIEKRIKKRKRIENIEDRRGKK